MDLGAPFRFAGDQFNKIPGVKFTRRLIDSPLGRTVNRAQSTFDALRLAQSIKDGRYGDAAMDALSTFGTMPVETYKAAKAVLATPLVKPLIAGTALVLADQRPARGALYGPGTPYETRAEFDADEDSLIPGMKRREFENYSPEQQRLLLNNSKGKPTATLSQTPPDPGDVQITPAPTTTFTATTSRQPNTPADRQPDTPVRANDETGPVSVPEMTKSELYDRARAKAVQTGKQEDLDLVRDLGLAMHADKFGKLHKGEPLLLADQKARAKSFLNTEIA